MKTIVCGVILLWASLAWGESAWLLWAHFWSKSRELSWDVIRARPTRDECMDDLRYYLARRQANDDKVKGSSVTVTQEGVPVRMDLSCLPDTIDPRAPKAK